MLAKEEAAIGPDGENLDELLRDLPSGDEATTPESHPPEEPSSVSRKVRSPVPYRYPVAAVSGACAEMVDHTALQQRLEDLCGQRDARGGLVSYSQIRVEVCQINLTMSRQNVRPPAYRPARKYPKGGQPTPERIVLSRDAKMHDLFWLHQAAGFRRLLEDKKYRHLMSNASFDFAMAEEFVAEAWRTEARVRDILVLSDVDQWPLAALVSQEVREYRQKLRKASHPVNARLRSYSQRTGRLKADVDDLTALWIAEQLCGGKHQRLIAQVHGWELGQLPLSPATISSKLKRLRLLLTKC